MPRKRNFNIAPYFKGIPTWAIDAAMLEFFSKTEGDPDWDPTDAGGEDLTEAQSKHVYNAMCRIHKAIADYLKTNTTIGI